MSDLQASLLIIGAVVVVGVLAFNWFQQRRLRRRLDGTRAQTAGEPGPRHPTRHESGRRMEPQLDPGEGARDVHGFAGSSSRTPSDSEPDAPRRAAVAALPDVPDFDPQVDYIAAIDGEEPISAAGLADLHTRAAASGRRSRVVGFNAQTGHWEEAGRLSGGRYAHLRVAVQLVSRKGILDAATLAAICDAVRACAARFAAVAYCPDIDAALAAARDVDAYCADVDVAIGVNIVAPAGARFAGTRIRALAEAAGFRLEPDGVFHYYADSRQTLFTLDNHDPAPFLPEQIKHLETGGITLLLDVPRVADGTAALEIMLKAAARLAEGLGGTVVDDNRVPLTDRSVGAIQQQLQSIRTRMEARGMAPGSERALRLFA